MTTLSSTHTACLPSFRRLAVITSREQMSGRVEATGSWYHPEMALYQQTCVSGATAEALYINLLTAKLASE
jgi:hypothetical protein